MRSALAILLLCALPTGAAAAADLHHLEIKGSGKITLARPHPQGELSIEIPAQFEAALTLAPGDAGWRARDADIKASVLDQKLRLRLRPSAPPDEQIYVEMNESPAGWGRRSDLAGVPLLGAPLALKSGEAGDLTWQVEFQPVQGEPATVLHAVLRLPGGNELLRFPVTLAAPEPSQPTRPWSASGRLGPLALPGPEEREITVRQLAWDAEGRAGKGVRAFVASVTVEAEFALPGSGRGALRAQVEIALDRVTPAETGS